MPTKQAAEQELIPKIRAAVIERVERTTLREVSRQIGMTPSGLMKFMSGSQPYRKIRRKLEAWHTRKAARAPAEQGIHSPDTAAAAIRVLATYFPPSERGAFVDEVLERLDPVLPLDSEWREELAGYGDFMRAGEIEAEDSAEGEAQPRRRQRRETGSE